MFIRRYIPPVFVVLLFAASALSQDFKIVADTSNQAAFPAGAEAADLFLKKTIQWNERVDPDHGRRIFTSWAWNRTGMFSSPPDDLPEGIASSRGVPSCR
jgi:hypothetical protein